jgi:hypothetical protein
MSADPDLVARTDAFLADLDTDTRLGTTDGDELDDGLEPDASIEYDLDAQAVVVGSGHGDDEFTDIAGTGGDVEESSGTEPSAATDPDYGNDPDYEIDPDNAADEGEVGYSSPAETTAFLEPSPDPAPEPAADDDDDEKPRTPARFSKPVVIGFVAITAVVAIGLSAAMIAMRPSKTVVSDQSSASAPQVAVIAAPPAPSGAAAPNSGADQPIPFTASADCPLGSTAAQAVAGTDRTRAWVCVRAGADGQVLTLDLGQPMKVTAISIVPGWVGADTSGADQWLQHRVITRVQWILINGDQRIAVPQNTNNVHGEAVQQMPGNGPDRGVLASQIQMIVQQTSRAPADTPAANPTPGAPGAPDQGGPQLTDVLGGPIGAPAEPPSSTPPAPLGGPASDSANGDPADNTFAVSSIKVIGHLPQ